MFNRDIKQRRFSKARLYNGGRMMHVARRKKTELEKYDVKFCKL